MSAQSREPKEKFMKAAKRDEDGMRTNYRREDFGVMVRGKYAGRIKPAQALIVLRPEIAKAFPTSEAVNDALATMLNIASEAKRVTAPPKRARKAA